MEERLMVRVLANDGMDKAAAKMLEDAGYEVILDHYPLDELKEKIKEVDVLIVRSATKVREELLNIAKDAGRLKLVIRAGVGVDNIDVAHAKEIGIEVRNTPLSSSDSVAELTIAHMFALARHIHISNVTMRNGEWNKKQYKGIELAGKTLGLIGFGRIARSVAKKANALGMDIIYTDLMGKMDGYDEFEFMSKEELIQKADFISLHIPFIKEQGAAIAEKEFDMMKDGVYLINCARGGVVCEESLLKALESGKVAAAGIDVFEEEPTKREALYTHPRVSITPHIGASTAEAQKRIGVETYETIINFFK
jgi:D-3-phosphoglycerate dehydrogenase